LPALFLKTDPPRNAEKTLSSPSSKKRKENQQARDADIYNKKTKPKPNYYASLLR